MGSKLVGARVSFELSPSASMDMIICSMRSAVTEEACFRLRKSWDTVFGVRELGVLKTSPPSDWLLGITGRGTSSSGGERRAFFLCEFGYT